MAYAPPSHGCYSWFTLTLFDCLAGELFSGEPLSEGLFGEPWIGPASAWFTWAVVVEVGKPRGAMLALVMLAWDKLALAMLVLAMLVLAMLVLVKPVWGAKG
jgi:hypothetical protein